MCCLVIISRIKNYWKECNIDLQELLKVFCLYHAERFLRLGLWTLEERRNRCDLTEVFKMFYGYTEVDIRVLFTFDSNDKGLRGHSNKICKSRFNTDIKKYFPQIESLTDGTVWTRTLLMHSA